MIKNNRGKMQDLIKQIVLTKKKKFTDIYLIDEEKQVLEYKTLDQETHIIGGIYAGIVENINYSLGVIFVKLDKCNGFLSFKNVHEKYYINNKFNIKKNDKILVEVVKEAHAEKLLSLTTYISLPGEYCIYLPYSKKDHGISQKIKGEIRHKLKQIIKTLNINGTLIMRTNAMQATSQEINKDYLKLVELEKNIIKKFEEQEKAALLYSHDYLLKFIRSYILIAKKIICTSQSIYYKIKKYIKNKSFKYNGEIVYEKNLDNQISKNIENIHKTRIMLHSGGEIVFQKTEACVVIDINSKYCNKKNNQEDNAFLINQEAAQAIVEQIILKNIGGLIIIDFIDMKNTENIEKINKIIKHRLKTDTSSNKFIPYNELGIVQISRQKLGLNLLDKLIKYCNKCSNYS